MRMRLPDVRGPGPDPATRHDRDAVARLPVANAVAAVVITIAALAASITVLLVLPGQLEALGTVVALAGSGFTLAAKIAVPRSG
ncbi:hypothetical protein ACWD00_31565 [Streptomyces viridiviolaceus]